MAQWIEGEIVSNRRWTENLFSLKVDADAEQFVAGQFTSLALDIDGQRVARPYSYLTSPGERPLEFFLYRALGGVLSNALIEKRAGETVWIKTPANGFFVLREIPPCEEMWMLATGTGISPYFSILNTDEPWRRFRRVALVHAVRLEMDLRYQELVGNLRRKHGERFVFQSFVSREPAPGAIRGRIPAAIADGELERRTGLELSPDKSHFMLCGNPDMVRDTTETLKALGFAKNRRRAPGHVTVESYW